MIFEGFPAEAFGFYARLEADNTREFWNAHKGEYQRFVREPMIALGEELELLRYRSLTASRDWPAGPAVSGRSAVDLIRQTWIQLVPLCDWLGEHVGAAGA